MAFSNFTYICHCLLNKDMNIELLRVDDAFRLEAKNSRGDILYSDGSASIGAGEDGWRPMELLLVSLAGCSSIDVISILKKQRQKVDKFSIEVSGTRKDGVPAPYETINVHFKVKGEVKESKLEKALELTKGKYCSVYFSLHPDIEVTYSYSLED